MLTQAQLKSKLHYNPETGIFTWIKSKKSVNIGKPAGHFNNLGYKVISINSISYLAHRLAWLYVYEYIPDTIDHIDGNPSNNAISNLRKCTLKQNQHNRKINKNNSSGIKGVYFSKNHNKWRAEIRVNLKKIHVGLFNNLNDAKIAIEEARIEHHKDYANHG